MLSKTGILLPVIIILLGFGFSLRLDSDKVQTIPKDRYLKLSFKVKGEPRISGKWQIIKAGDLTIFSEYYPGYRVGDVITVEGMVDDTGRMFTPEIKVEERKNSFGAKLSDLRNLLVSRIESMLPSREASLVAGMLLGSDKIDRVFRDQLIDTGTIHVVVVSGQNLSIVAYVFLALSGYIGRRWALFASFLAVSVYAVLAGFEPPVVRAMIMVVATTGAVLTGREAAPFWSLVLAAFCILFVWPRSLFDVSFQLTFAATLGIITLGKYLGSRFNFKFSIFNLFKENAAIAISAFLFTMPVIYLNFERVALISPIVNVIIAETVLPVMVLGFAALVAGLIFTPAGLFLAYFAYIPATFFVGIVQLFSS